MDGLCAVGPNYHNVGRPTVWLTQDRMIPSRKDKYYIYNKKFKASKQKPKTRSDNELIYEKIKQRKEHF